MTDQTKSDTSVSSEIERKVTQVIIVTNDGGIYVINRDTEVFKQAAELLDSVKED